MLAKYIRNYPVVKKSAENRFVQRLFKEEAEIEARMNAPRPKTLPFLRFQTPHNTEGNRDNISIGGGDSIYDLDSEQQSVFFRKNGIVLTDEAFLDLPNYVQNYVNQYGVGSLKQWLAMTEDARNALVASVEAHGLNYERELAAREADIAARDAVVAEERRVKREAAKIASLLKKAKEEKESAKLVPDAKAELARRKAIKAKENADKKALLDEAVRLAAERDERLAKKNAKRLAKEELARSVAEEAQIALEAAALEKKLSDTKGYVLRATKARQDKEAALEAARKESAKVKGKGAEESKSK